MNEEDNDLISLKLIELINELQDRINKAIKYTSKIIGNGEYAHEYYGEVVDNESLLPIIDILIGKEIDDIDVLNKIKGENDE